jgi:class 3 adenylate cyclase
MIPKHVQTEDAAWFDPVESDSGISTMPFKQRFGPAAAILVVGFIVGVGLRFSIDDAAERDLANYVRSGLHGSGVAFAAWIVQGFFAAKAHSPIGAALRRMPLLAEVLVRSLIMTVVIVIVGLSLQIALYADSLQLRWLTVHWFKTTLPWIVAIGLTMSLMVGVVIETARLIGGPLLASIVLGTYQRPVREQLIVMFLDLADSTSLAEKLGELRVHNLITRFFFDIDEPIHDHGGSVLSYVGDEVIVTWAITDDLARNARCLACFFAIDNKIDSLSSEYKEAFETVPRFRAGLHSGPVIVSECGGFKRQLAYFGDTMNVSARLCEYCKVCGCNLIVSSEVLSHVTIPQNLQISVGQSIALRGRNSLLEVHEAHQIADN